MPGKYFFYDTYVSILDNNTLNPSKYKKSPYVYENVMKIFG